MEGGRDQAVSEPLIHINFLSSLICTRTLHMHMHTQTVMCFVQCCMEHVKTSHCVLAHNLINCMFPYLCLIISPIYHTHTDRF